MLLAWLRGCHRSGFRLDLVARTGVLACTDAVILLLPRCHMSIVAGPLALYDLSVWLLLQESFALDIFSSI